MKIKKRLVFSEEELNALQEVCDVLCDYIVVSKEIQDDRNELQKRALEARCYLTSFLEKYNELNG